MPSRRNPGFDSTPYGEGQARKISLSGRSHIEVFYSKGHTKVPLPATADPLAGLLTALSKARKSIIFGIFSLTSADIAALLLAKHQRGLTVYGVADTNSAKSPTAKVNWLRNGGVDIKLVGRQYSLMHLKVAVIDDVRTASGSYNWTTAAERSNDEILTVISNRQLATVARAQIDVIRAAAA